MASRSTRRGLFLLAGAALWTLGVPRLLRTFDASDFDFQPIDGLPRFRRVSGGEATGAAGRFVDAFAGIGTGPDAGIDAGTDAKPDTGGASSTDASGPGVLSSDALCADLFGREGDADPAGPVPVAIFTDAYCAFCRVHERHLEELEAGGAIRLHWHHLPILGPASVIAARAMVAADLQGAGADVRRRLQRARVRGDPAWLRSFAGSAGLDADRFVAAVTPERAETGAANGAANGAGDAVSAVLARDAAMARTLGFFATPGTVTGGTVFDGAMDADRLGRLVEIERARPHPCVPGADPD